MDLWMPFIKVCLFIWFLEIGTRWDFAFLECQSDFYYARKSTRSLRVANIGLHGSNSERLLA